MDRQVVQLHTIDQWVQQDESIRTLILKNIRLKDRLHRYLYSLNGKKGGQPSDPKWVRCSKCADSPSPGWILQEPRYDGLHPSAMGHPCLLNVYNGMVGVEGQERIEPRVKLIFDLGHAVHHMFQTYGMNGAWGPHYSREVEINGAHQVLADELLIEGHADADNILIMDDIPGAPIYEVGLVHEYKTINDNGFKKLTSAKPEHKQQGLLYSATLNRPITVFLYLNKNDSNLSDFPVQFDHAQWERLKAKALLLRQHYDQKQPPEGSVGFHCQDCPYVYTCSDYKAFQPTRR